MSVLLCAHVCLMALHPLTHFSGSIHTRRLRCSGCYAQWIQSDLECSFFPYPTLRICVNVPSPGITGNYYNYLSRSYYTQWSDWQPTTNNNLLSTSTSRISWWRAVRHHWRVHCDNRSRYAFVLCSFQQTACLYIHTVTVHTYICTYTHNNVFSITIVCA